MGIGQRIARNKIVHNCLAQDSYVQKYNIRAGMGAQGKRHNVTHSLSVVELLPQRNSGLGNAPATMGKIKAALAAFYLLLCSR
jgi:hypothetical protein